MKEYLYDILAALLPVPLIWAYENGRQPENVFAALDVRSADASLPVMRAPISERGSRALSAVREAAVTVQCYGDGAFEFLDALAMALQTEAAADALEIANAAVFDIERVQSVPKLREVNYEAQAVLSFRYRYMAAMDETVPVIEKAVLDVTTRQ